MSSDLRLAMLISGSGTTMREIILATKSKRLTGICPALVVGSSSEAGGLAVAKELGMKEESVVVCDPRQHRDKESFGHALIAHLRRHGIDLIGQYGWLPLTPEIVVRQYINHAINQHPGPLDPGYEDFGGKGMFGRRVHQARLNFVASTDTENSWTEATAQLVAPEFDKGSLLKITRVPILPDDTADSLRERVLPVEYEVQIATLQAFADDRVQKVNRSSRLIRPGEEPILREAKRLAIKAYPRG